MSQTFVLSTELREDQGKGASRRLRRLGKVPAVIYGGNEPPRAITLDHNELLNNLANEAFFASVLTLRIGGEEQQAILKDLQRHPAKRLVLHADFQRIVAGESIRVHVPLHFLNEERAPGVKQSGGIVSHHMTEVEVSCLPRNLPEYLEVDVADLEVDEALHLSDIRLPEGVEIVALSHGEGADYDQPVVSIHRPRREAAATESEDEAAAPAEPEAPAAGEEEPGED